MAGRRPKGSPERIGLVLGRTTASTALAGRLKDLEIWQGWEKAVGPAIAARAKPLRIIGGTLTIQVASGPWMQQLSFMKADLCQRINGMLGEERVREIVLKSGRVVAEQAAKQAEPKPQREITAAQRDWIRHQVAGLPDPELQQAVEALMEMHYRHELKKQ